MKMDEVNWKKGYPNNISNFILFRGHKMHNLIDLVMGPGQKILTRAGSDKIFVARVGSGQPSLV